MLLEHGHQFVVDVDGANAVSEGVDPGAQQPLGVLEIADMRGDPKAPIVRLVDEGAIESGGQLLVPAPPIVDIDPLSRARR
jgi:hypothetical protein